ncbi:MAG TPA: hypothetical protein VF962_15040, partial [Gemmatimonadaceae bacterium]
MDRSCASCGKQLQADQGFCDSCGKAWVSPAPNAIPSADAPGARPRSSNKPLLLAIVVIVALAALGAGGWFV